MEQPLGFQIPHSKGMVYRLNKALYGLRHNCRAYNEKIDSFLWHKGFHRAIVDLNLYIHMAFGLTMANVVYVNDHRG